MRGATESQVVTPSDSPPVRAYPLKSHHRLFTSLCEALVPRGSLFESLSNRRKKNGSCVAHKPSSLLVNFFIPYLNRILILQSNITFKKLSRKCVIPNMSPYSFKWVVTKFAFPLCPRDRIKTRTVLSFFIRGKMGVFENLIYVNDKGDVASNFWIKWIHEGTKEANTNA